MNVDTILVVSPGYIDAIKACLGRYVNFCIAGYSEVGKAIRALPHLPGENILGVAYLHDYIRQEDVNELRTLLNKVNIMFQDVVDEADSKSRIPFLFLLSTKQGGASASSEYVKRLISEVGTNNLDVGYYDYDVVTDTLIKVQLFGTIILRRRPFEVAKSEIAETFNNDKHLVINLPFDQKFVEIYEPLTFIEVDSFMQRYLRDSLICMIRSYMYSRSESLMGNILKRLGDMPFCERIPYESVLRNLDLLKE